jgi:twinkle protein
MNNDKMITAKEYLDRKGIKYRIEGEELVTHCLFNGCDNDSKGKESHLYIHQDTGLYDCKKCSSRGNLITLAKHFGDGQHDLMIVPIVQRKDKGIAKKVGEYNDALNQKVRQYLNNRGISDDLIDQYQLGIARIKNRNWITIPIRDEDGQYQYFKLRVVPESEGNGPKYITEPKGAEAQLYELFSLDLVEDTQDRLVICEGEFDMMLLRSKGIRAITGTHGVNTFKNEWVSPLMKYKDIYVCFDNDDAGRRGAARVLGLFDEAGHTSLHDVRLPLSEKGADISDYILAGNDVEDLLTKCSKKYTKGDVIDRVVPVPKPSRLVEFEKWREVVAGNFPELVFASEVILSVICQILLTDVHNPFGLVLVDDPASGKTLTLNLFKGAEEIVYLTDKFTPASFVSSSSNVQKDELDSIDLLPRIKNKVLVVPELAPIFSKRDEDLREGLGMFTRVMDGEGLSIDTAVHGRRSYSGDYLFMFLGATTPIRNRVWNVMGSLGSRLLFLSLATPDKTEEELVEQLLSGDFKAKEKECQLVTKELIYRLWHDHPEGIIWDRTKDRDEKKIMDLIARSAKFLALMRGVIDEVEDDGDFESSGRRLTAEKPNRLSQLLYNLARGHAVAVGRKSLAMEDLIAVLALTFDSAHPSRVETFKALLANGGSIRTSQLERALHVSKPTALLRMKTLITLGVCVFIPDPEALDDNDAEHTIALQGDFMWFASDECKQLMQCKMPIK